MVAALRACRTAQPRYPHVILFSTASVEATGSFLAERWPDAIAIVDPPLVVQTACTAATAPRPALLDVRVLGALFRALRHGHGLGRVQGSVSARPGLLLIDGESVRWEHPFEHIGDHPDFAAIPTLAGLEPDRARELGLDSEPPR
jgi:hypothetical protein